MIRRFWYWLEHGPGISLREFLSVLALIFIFLTILIAGVMYLYRENKHRITEVHSAIIQACRDSNDVRGEVRNVIQDLKNVPPQGFTVDQIQQRYDRLTHAIAFLRDERCDPLRTKP